MDFIYEASRRLNIEQNYTTTLNYSGKVKGFRALVRKRGDELNFTLSKNWREVSEEIKIGLVQELLEKILHSEKQKTMNKELYRSFIKNAHIAIPKTKTHPLLAQAFDKLNKQFFDELLEKPNFCLSSSRRTLGCYEYGTDTITITKYLLNQLHLLEYVMYHEMLHKKHKFSSVNERSMHHSKSFKADEKIFPNAEQYEKELSQLVQRFPKNKSSLISRFFS